MSLRQSPVTAAEIEDLQFGLTFTTNSAQAAAQVSAINAGTTTVANYAALLLDSSIATAQVAMAATCLMWGQTQDTALLENIATLAAPLFINLAIQFGTDQVTTVAEGVGVALADDAQFAPFLAFNEIQFAQTVTAATGVSVTAINGWLAGWIDFYTTFGTPAPDVTVQEAAYGATFGDAIGVALQNPTGANLETTVSPEGAIEGVIANLLILVAEDPTFVPIPPNRAIPAGIADLYVVGVPCETLLQHFPLWGEPF